MPADAALTAPTSPPAAARRASILVQRRIEWADTDASGHYHHTAALRLFEAAETALLARLGLRDAIYGRLPRVSIRVDFRDRLLFGDLVDVHVAVSGVGRSSVTYTFDITRDGRTCAEGHVTAVQLDGPFGHPIPWSDEHRALLTRAGEQPGEYLTAHA